MRRPTEENPMIPKLCTGGAALAAAMLAVAAPAALAAAPNRVASVEVDGPRVKVIHSLTSMGCPAGPMIQEDIVRTAREINGVEDVQIELTWDPPWTPDRMSDDAKFILGIG